MTKQSRWQRWGSGLIAVAAAALVIAAPAAPASALENPDTVVEWTSEAPYCNQTMAHLSVHSNGTLVMRAGNYATKPVTEPSSNGCEYVVEDCVTSVCERTGGPERAEWMILGWRLYHWSGSSWSECLSSGGWWDRANTYQFDYSRTFTTPPCGDGYYVTEAYGARYDDGQWHGDERVASEYRYYSAS